MDAVTTTNPAFTTSVYVFDCDCGVGVVLSSTPIVNEYVPATVGVPEMLPVGLISMPVGLVPEMKYQVVGATAPPAISGWLYATPTDALGSESGVIVIAA